MATQQVVNVGTQANDATGDLLRDAFTKINNNFAVFFTGNFPTAQMTIGPPVSGNALTAIGISGSAAIVATAFSVTDISLTASGTASFAGGVTFGSPTGGNKGSGSFNAASGFINNVAVATGTTVSSFTSNTGLSSNVAATGAVTVTNTGVLSVTTNTGLSSNVAATGAVTITNTGVISLAGTANQITVSASTGAVTLTLPSNIVIPTPGSGVALTMTGFSGSQALLINSGSGASTAVADVQINRAGSTINTFNDGPNITLFDSTNSTGTEWQNSGGQSELWQFNGSWNQVLKSSTTRAVTFNSTLGINGNAPPAQVTGWGTPVGGVAISNYNITDAGGANSNTNKAVAQIIATLKAFGLFGT